MGAPILITIDVALAGVTAVGFDTAPIIYFIERHPSYVALMREVFRRVDAGAVAGYSSTITLTEVLTQPYQLQNDVLARRYRTLLLRSRNFTVVPVDASIAGRRRDACPLPSAYSRCAANCRGEAGRMRRLPDERPYLTACLGYPHTDPR